MSDDSKRVCGYVNLREHADGGYVCSECGRWFEAEHMTRARAMVGEKEFARLERERRANEART